MPAARVKAKVPGRLLCRAAMASGSRASRRRSRASLAALMVYAYFNRRKIAEKIEGYIVEHSEISEKEPEEVEVETD